MVPPGAAFRGTAGREYLEIRLAVAPTLEPAQGVPAPTPPPVQGPSLGGKSHDERRVVQRERLLQDLEHRAFVLRESVITHAAFGYPDVAEVISPDHWT